MKKVMMMTAMLAVSAHAMAIDPPLKSETLTDGTTYILFNYANPSKVLSKDLPLFDHTDNAPEIPVFRLPAYEF